MLVKLVLIFESLIEIRKCGQANETIKTSKHFPLMPMKYGTFPSCIKCLSVTNFAVIERLGFTFYCLSHPNNKGGPRHSSCWVKFNILNVSIFSFYTGYPNTPFSSSEGKSILCKSVLSSVSVPELRKEQVNQDKHENLGTSMQSKMFS